jgi:hypothetical protein
VRPTLTVSLLLACLCSACATHSYRIQGNKVTLVLRRPEAKSVMLAASLDGFNLRPADRVSTNWEVILPADKAFRYFYQVDGKMVVPDCPMKERDDFGSENCIFDPQL